ncbi:MAG: hypothetical protein MJZ20_11085 [Bacteroidaceae bacterium]|nr:hypothetical protein [Bacteroidaceae bacterium]
MESKIIKKNFFIVGNNGDTALYEDQLGWNEIIIKSAYSDNPETIFRYVVEVVGYNILFYWTKDARFYTIETENLPIEVRRIYPNPDWDGKCEYMKAGTPDYGPTTASAGEVIATFDDPTQIWDNLKIDGVSIGEVLSQSAILDLD